MWLPLSPHYAAAETMPLQEFETFITISRRQRRAKDDNRWDRDWPILIKQFNMEFKGSMKERVESELKSRIAAEKKARRP